MTLKYLYMKLVGLLIVTIGFSYSITTFYNLFDVIFGDKKIPASYNIYVMGISVIFPLFVFIFGVFFYLYADFKVNKKSLWTLICIIIILIFGVVKILLTLPLFMTLPYHYIFDFVHVSFGYVAIILSVLLVYGRIKYKY